MDASSEKDLQVCNQADVEGQKMATLQLEPAVDEPTRQDIRRLCIFKVFKFGAHSKSQRSAGDVTLPEQLDANSKKSHPRKGGWRTSPLIFGTEVCEKLAESGLHANLITYLVQQLHMQTVEAANTITNFNGSSNLSPIIGAYLADAYLGRFRAIAIGSFFFLLGIVLLAVDAMVPSLKPPQCAINDTVLERNCVPASSKQKAFLIMAFGFLVFGAGGIRPCVAAFGADQFDQNDPEERKSSSKFFNWYYFSLSVSLLFAATVLVYVQDNVDWSWGFGIAAILMGLSLTCFLCGYKLYRHAISKGNPFVRLAQVLVCAIRNRNERLPIDSSDLYRGSEGDGNNGAFVPLKHTDQFSFLDKAAIVPESTTTTAEANMSSPWKLCTLHQVEEFKCLVRILPIWATGILFTTAHAQQSTLMVQQARTMERHLGGSRFQVPAASFTVFSFLALFTWVPIYDRIVVPALRRVTGKERGITCLQRIGTGLLISVIAMFVAGATERERLHTATRAGLTNLPHKQVPLSAFVLVPQYCLLGLAESFVLIGQLELFYDQFPESMRSLAGALFSSSHAIGSYSSSIVINVIQSLTDHKKSGSHSTSTGGWIQNNLNRGHLDYFYWILGLLGTINFIVFLFCARWYKYKNLRA